MQRLARGLLRLAGPLAVAAFWSGIAAAAHAYPGDYDWRYQTISVLLYSDRDPGGYLWAWAAVELCGLAGLAWTVDLHQPAANAIAAPSATALGILRVGFLCMCCAALPDRLLPLSKGHELLAILAFLGICIGVAQQIFRAVDDRGPRGRHGLVARLSAPLLASLPAVPMALAALTQAYLGLVRPDLPWVSPAWRVHRIPLYLSFAVWEWVTCAVFSMCLLALSYRRSQR